MLNRTDICMNYLINMHWHRISFFGYLFVFFWSRKVPSTSWNPEFLYPFYLGNARLFVCLFVCKDRTVILWIWTKCWPIQLRRWVLWECGWGKNAYVMQRGLTRKCLYAAGSWVFILKMATDKGYVFICVSLILTLLSTPGRSRLHHLELKVCSWTFTVWFLWGVALCLCYVSTLMWGLNVD